MMSKPGTTIEPEIQENDTSSLHGGWIVTVFNNDYNTYQEVMAILMVATRCTQEEAYMEAWEIDNLGKSVVHHGNKEACQTAADIISKIGIRVEVSEE